MSAASAFFSTFALTNIIIMTMTKIRVECCDVLYALPFTAHKTDYVLINCGKLALTNYRISEYQIQHLPPPLKGLSATPDKRQHFNEDRASISVSRTNCLEQGGLKHFFCYLCWELFHLLALPYLRTKQS